MRADAPPPWAEVTQETTVAVTLGSRTLATGIPVASGRLAVQVDQDVPERLDLTLPREWEQYALDPRHHAAVLGSDGHRIEVTTVLTDGSRTWRLRLGTYLVTSWEVDGASVTVQAAGLLTLVQEHDAPAPRLLGARSPAVGELMALIREDGLEPIVHPAVPSHRTVGAEFEVGEDRFAALQALATAIPAVVQQSWDGAIHIRPALDEAALSPVLSWSDGEAGTVVAPAASGDREGLYNHIVAQWSREVTVRDEDGNESTETEEGYVEKFAPDGILSRRSFGIRTRTIPADGIESHAQAQAVATNEAARAHLRARTLEVEMAVDWRAEADDPVSVTLEGETSVGRVTGIEYPLTPTDGAMAATVGVPA